MKVNLFKIKEIPDIFVINAFVVSTVHAFFLMLGFDFKLGIALILASVLCLFKSMKDIKWGFVTISVVIFLAHSIFTFLLNDYDVSAFYFSLVYELSAILFYFIGQSLKYSSESFYKGLVLCTLFASLVGYYLYFVNPEWYSVFRYSNISDSTNPDLFRFSSFWYSPYSISYLSCCAIIFSACNIIKNRRVPFFLLILYISLLSIILTQQRVALAYSALVIVYMLYEVCRYSNVKTRKDVFVSLLCIFLLGLLVFSMFIYGLDEETLEFAFGKIKDINSNMVSDRIGIYEKWLNKPIPILGDGSGRYSHFVASTGNAITDCEYLKILFEKGIIGFFFFMIICLATIIRGIKRKVTYKVELLIVLFYMVAMIGADPISGTETRAWLFWYCIGRINSKYSISLC